MQKSLFVLTIATMLAPACALAVDGQVLINQATVTAAGDFHIQSPSREVTSSRGI
jgi:hypothetical protein